MARTRILITGANGFIGRNLISRLTLDSDFLVTSIYRDLNKVKFSKSNNLKLIECDLNNINSLRSKINNEIFDIFIHLAWEGTSGQKRFSLDTQLENIKTSANLVKLAKDIGCYRFIGIGSIMETESIFATNTNLFKPSLNNIYGVSKFTAHSITKSIAADIGIEHLWLRISNTYGPLEISSRLIYQTLNKINNRETLFFSKASQNYDFIFIADAVEIISKLILKGENLNNYLISSNSPRTLREYLDEIIDLFEYHEKVIFENTQSNIVSLPLKDFIDERVTKITSIKPQIDFKSGLKKTMEWVDKTNGQK